MNNYDYFVPHNFEDALKIKGEGGADVSILAGGTDLIIRLKEGKMSTKALLDISKLGLEYIKESGNEIIIGSMTSLSEIRSYINVLEPILLLSEAAKEVGAVQTRNMGTIGGNICIGNACSDMGVALLALNAKLKMVSKIGEKVFPITDFFIEPGKCRINDDEILKEIIIDLPKEDGLWGSSFIKIGKRKASRISIVGVGTVINIEPINKIIKDIRIAMSTVAPIPTRLEKVEKFLEGKKYSEDLLNEALNLLVDDINPRTSLRATKEYRIDLAKTLFKRTIIKAVEKAFGEDEYK